MELTSQIDAVKGEDNIFNGDATVALDPTAQIWFTAKRRKSDPDSAIVISKGPTGVTVSDAPNGIYQITLTPADTANLTDRALVYDIKLKQPPGPAIQTLISGVLLLVDTVKQA